MTKRVIVADDEVNIRDFLYILVESCVPDAKIDSVADGESLVQKVMESDYDLIFTDHDMGQGMNGVDAIKAIRATNTKVPIYMISGSDKREDALKAGATGYLEKPVGLNKIKELTSKYL